MAIKTISNLESIVSSKCNFDNQSILITAPMGVGRELFLTSVIINLLENGKKVLLLNSEIKFISLCEPYRVLIKENKSSAKLDRENTFINLFSDEPFCMMNNNKFEKIFFNLYNSNIDYFENNTPYLIIEDIWQYNKLSSLISELAIFKKTIIIVSTVKNSDTSIFFNNGFFKQQITINEKGVASYSVL